MNGPRDIERTLDLWLVDGPSVMPDRLFDAVLDRVERTPQRRLARLHLRLTEMNPRIRLYAAAAAALIVALAGIYLFNRAQAPNVGAPPSPTVSPTATPAIVDVPIALREVWMGPAQPIPSLDPGAGVTLNFTGLGDFYMTESASNVAHRLRSKVTAIDGLNGRVELTTDGADVDCQAGEVGVYRWSLSASGRALSLVATADDCASRLAAVPGTYWLMNCPTAADNCLGPVDAGTYSSQFFDPFVETGADWRPRFDVLNYTVPDGWTNVDDWPDFFRLRPTGAPDTTIIELVRDVVITKQGELCSEVPDPNLGTTAEDISAWLATAPGVVASDVQAVQIGGLNGARVDVSLDPAWTDTCPWSEGRPVHMLFTDRPDAEGFSWALETGFRSRLYFLDVGPGRAILINAAATTDDFDAFAAQAAPVIESFVFTR